MKNNDTKIEIENYAKDTQKETGSLSLGVSGMGIGITGIGIGCFLQALGYTSNPNNDLYAGAHILGGGLLVAMSLVHTVRSFQMIKSSMKEKNKTLKLSK